DLPLLRTGSGTAGGGAANIFRCARRAYSARPLHHRDDTADQYRTLRRDGSAQHQDGREGRRAGFGSADAVRLRREVPPGHSGGTVVATDHRGISAWRAAAHTDELLGIV